MEKKRKIRPLLAGRIFSTLRSRLMLLVLLASLPALALIAYTNIEQRQHDTNEAVTDALADVRQVAHEHLNLTQETRVLLSVLSRSIDIDNGPAMSKLFAELIREQDVYSNIGFIDADGFTAASAIPFTPPVYAGDRLYFKRAAESLEFAIGDYQIGRVTKTAGVNFGFPVVRQGRLKGVLFAALPIQTLVKKLSTIPFKEGQAISIIDVTGTVLARYPAAAGLIGKKISGTEIESLLLGAPSEGTAHMQGLDGVERLYAYTKLRLSDDNSLLIRSGAPVAVIYAKADRMLTRNAIISAGTTLLVLLLAWFASDKLVLKSVQDLMAVTRELGSGKRKARAKVDSGSEELNHLAHSINEMADALEAHQEEVERHLARIARLNRIYALLSGINSAIIRTLGKDELLREACRIAVEQGSFAMAWAAMTDDSGRLYPAAWAGREKEYIDRLMENMSPDGEHKPLALSAFLENREIIAGDFEKDMELAPWKELASRYGYRSAAAFPLRVEGKPVGALSLYSLEPGFFHDEEELKLLLELASDTSLGLEKIEKEARLDYLSRFDTLTGLVNRWVFEDHLEQAVTRARHNGRHVTVIMLDIEEFSRVNDTLGFGAGDEVLKALARYLSSSVRDGDTVARLGNDNFGIILQDLASREDSVTVVEKITRGVPSTVHFGGEGVFIRTYSGIAVFPDDGSTSKELMQNTELAMHSCESSGGPVLYYSQEINARAQEQRAIETELRQAMERKELELFYQPIVAVEGRRIVAVEALLRWTNQKLGAVPPDRFIPVAEKTGLIVAIGEWVMKTAFAQAREWERRGIRDLRVGVNVSVRQIRQQDFCERLQRIIGYDYGSRSVRLAIEITESELMKNMDIFVKSLKELRSLGLLVYIDDFGTGYSSLSYLKDLPIDTLKIDRSFIKDIATDSSSLSMAMGIIAIANSLGLEVVAEGVETNEQLTILDDLGCAYAQGYLFSRPLPARLVEPLLFNQP